MGLASSQARLLTITARLTSNEYESQQITNAKMRLATQTQAASETYIAALNSAPLTFTTYDTTGSPVNTPLTAAALYEYNDGKNQYLLTNASGKALVSAADIANYQSSRTLDEFLEKYNVEKEFKTEALQDLYNSLHSGVYVGYKNAYDDAVQLKIPTDWSGQKLARQNAYITALNKYTVYANKMANGDQDTNAVELAAKQLEMENAKNDFQAYVSQRSAGEYLLSQDPSKASIVENYTKYKNVLAQYTDELDRLGLSENNAYTYKDQSKAQWYTNLWYKLNGQSTDNTGSDNFVEMSPKSMNSTEWITDSLTKGYITIEQATYNNEPAMIAEEGNPFKFNLQGIKWNTKTYTSCADITHGDNDKAVAQAEAEYTRKTAEINAKDEKYQRKLSLLDSEHHAIQTEYDSVKSAMDKNIQRSFKAFQG